MKYNFKKKVIHNYPHQSKKYREKILFWITTFQFPVVLIYNSVLSPSEGYCGTILIKDLELFKD